MQIDLTQIILAVIALISAIVTGFVIPVLKSKLTGQQLDALKAAAKIAVYAAEQLHVPEEWAEKKKYAQQILAEQGYDIDSDKVDAAIEAAVKELRIILAGGTKDKPPEVLAENC